LSKVASLFAQALCYALFFLPLVWLTSAPAYQQLPPELAVIKLAVRHAGAIIGECTALTSEEYADLPANMQRVETCPRERSPLRLQLLLDGETLYRESVPASGLHNDGVSSMYHRFELAAGSHHLRVLMNDDQAVAGDTWELSRDIELVPAQVLVVSFREGFRLE
jgi:hypothetical protein